MIFRRTFFITAFFLGLFFFFSPAGAFTIQPVRYRLTIDPGGSATARVAVLNDESAPHRFRASVTGGRPLFGTFFNIAEDWVQPDKNTFFLEPGEKKLVTFTINVPPQADSGSHFLALVIEPSDVKNGEVGLSARAAALLSLTVSGVVNEAVSIDRFEPLARFSASGEWPFTASLKNRGTVSVKLAGALIVKNAFGQIIAGPEAPLGNSVLPGSIRTITQKIELDRARFRLPGWYTVNLAVHYGLSKSVTEARAIVWYFPPWSAAAGLGLAGIILLILLKKYYSKKSV